MNNPKKPKSLPPEERRRIMDDTAQMARRVPAELFRRSMTMSDDELCNLHGRMARLSRAWQEKFSKKHAA